METTPGTDLLEQLERLAAEHALAGLGVCSVEPFPEVQAEMARRLESGESGRPRFTYSDPEVATNLRATFPWAESLVVGAATYLPAAGRPGPAAPNSGRIARFATSDHYRPLRAVLGEAAALLSAAGFQAEVLVDDSRLVDRAAAVRAGVAWWGKSTMALAPRFGPWLLLGSLVTDAALPFSQPMTRDCGTCIACIPACPTGALDVEGVLDATRCISYWAQTPGLIPHDIRSAWGDRLYGCDECLNACPPGQRWEAGADERAGRVDLIALLEASDEDLLTEYSHFYIPRRDVRFLRRNALVALGHSGTSSAVPVVTRFMGSSLAVLRAHAAWTLGALGGPEAARALAAAADSEGDAEVLEEIARAQARIASAYPASMEGDR